MRIRVWQVALVSDSKEHTYTHTHKQTLTTQHRNLPPVLVHIARHHARHVTEHDSGREVLQA